MKIKKYKKNDLEIKGKGEIFNGYYYDRDIKI